MTREEIIGNLKYTMEKHKNDTVDTFGTNISLMCKDILDYLKQEPCEDAISREKLPQNATNGDVIESLFPNVGTNFSNIIDLRLWWSRPYKGRK